MKYRTKDDSHRNNYKNLSNNVVVIYHDGTQKVIFNTTEPHFVESEMSELKKLTIPETQQLIDSFGKY